MGHKFGSISFIVEPIIGKLARVEKLEFVEVVGILDSLIVEEDIFFVEFFHVEVLFGIVIILFLLWVFLLTIFFGGVFV